jgi:hypothetical protein
MRHPGAAKHTLTEPLRIMETKKRREARNVKGLGWRRRRREICYKVQRLTHIPAVRRK